MAIFSTIHPLACILPFLLISNTFLTPIFAQSTSPETIKIDDSSLDITYSTPPSGGNWTAFSPPNYTCPSGLLPCFTSSINPARVSQGTWHQAHGPAVATYKFTGTGVSVYLAYNNTPGSTLDLSFTVDGQGTQLIQKGTGVHDENGWMYDYVAFTASSLADKEHTLVINQSSSESTVLLDYIEVVRGETSPTSSLAVTTTPTFTSAVMASVITSAPAASKSSTASQAPLISTVFVTSGSSTAVAISTILPSSTSGTSPISSPAEQASSSKSFPLVPVLVASSGLVAAAIVILSIVLCIRRRKSTPKPQDTGSLPTVNEPVNSQSSSSSRYSYNDSPFQPFITPMPPVFTQPGNHFYANGMATRSQGSLVAHIDRMMASTNDTILASSVTRDPQQNTLSPHPAQIYSPSFVSSAEQVTTRPISSSTASLLPPSKDVFVNHDALSPVRPQPHLIPRDSVMTSSSMDSQSFPHSGGNGSQNAHVETTENLVYMNEIPIYKPNWI